MIYLAALNTVSKRHRVVLALTTATLALLSSSAVCAQDAAPTPGEIIVTANRASKQSIQKVPQSIAVISPQILDRNNTLGLTDLAHAVSSLNIVEAGPGINKIEMRGLTTGQLVPNSTSDVQDRSLVGVYIDEAAISLQGQNPDLKVLDLERIEVLRGPQGTLYGAGSMTGTIRYITAKPDASKTLGTMEAALSDSKHTHQPNENIRGMLNVPLVQDIAALRLTAYYGHDAGYIDNIGAQNIRGANSVDTFQGRAALRVRASETFVADLSYTYLDLNAYGLNRGFYNTPGNPGNASGSQNFPDYSFSSSGPEHNKDRMHLLNLTLDKEVADGHLISSTSYTHRKLDFLESLEPTVAYFYQYAPAIAPNGQTNPFTGLGATYNQSVNNQLPAESYSIKNTINDFQEELRYASDQTRALKFTIGGFYQKQTRHYRQDIPFAGFDTLSYYAQKFNAANPGQTYNSQTTDGAFGPNDLFSGLQNSSEHQIAAFGEATLDITPKLSVTAGARAYHWKENFNLYFGGTYGVIGSVAQLHIPGTLADSESASGVNPKIRIAYQADSNLLVYAEAQKGVRYGGINQIIPRSTTCDNELLAQGVTPPAPTKFGPDSLWSYSVGEKGRFANNRITLNADAFYIVWSSVQNHIVLPKCSYYYIQNVGTVHSKGLEIDAAARITNALTVNVNASYTDATTQSVIPAAQNMIGDKVPNFPGTVVSFGTFYDAPIGSNKLHLQGNWQFRSAYQNTYNQSVNIYIPTSQAFNYRHIPAQDSLNASLSYEFGKTEIGLFGTNLTNGTKITNIVPKAYYVAGFQPGDYVTYARPRTIGIRIKVKL